MYRQEFGGAGKHDYVVPVNSQYMFHYCQRAVHVAVDYCDCKHLVAVWKMS